MVNRDGNKMNYKITINDFEGPLDLLLHLIKKSDMDIFDISIEEITKQYLNFIIEMETMNLDVASEYLVMAAELIEMKSGVLLPKHEVEADEYEEDPREKLINRLLEYQQYKEVTSEFKNLEEMRKEIHTKVRENLKEYQSDEITNMGDIDLNALLDAFSKFLSRKEEEKPLNTTITAKEYSVKERSSEIKTLLKTKKKVKFTELFEVRKKDYVIVTFLSILNLAKKQELVIKQDDNFDDIILSLKDGE